MKITIKSQAGSRVKDPCWTWDFRCECGFYDAGYWTWDHLVIFANEHYTYNHEPTPKHAASPTRPYDTPVPPVGPNRAQVAA
jgi:hypothetical protein